MSSAFVREGAPARGIHTARTKAAPTLRLPYRAPYDFAALLAFFERRAIPGVESVDADTYTRRFALDGVPGSLRVSAIDGEDALALRVDFPHAAALPDIAARVRRMFDLDAAIVAINTVLASDRRLRALVRRHPGQRLPGGWEGFEIAIRAVLGQQVTVAAARTLTQRVVQRYGVVLPGNADPPLRLFPAPATLADADFAALGITRQRAQTLRTVARAVGDGTVHFRPGQSLDAFVASWTALPGIGAWTAHYLAMRGLGEADAFPAADIVLRKAFARDGIALPARELEALSQAWRPWRAYAVLHLWRAAA
jgi:AraC family transcriptional regulator of adaptative response / DNA-3-methyladenine glycosylase II